MLRLWHSQTRATVTEGDYNMKYHKIKNIDKSVCTAEQKIAYNLAWYECCGAENLTADDCENVIEGCMKHWSREIAKCPKSAQYDSDAILASLNAGMRNYIASGCRIPSSYEAVGEMFPATI